MVLYTITVACECDRLCDTVNLQSLSLTRHYIRYPYPEIYTHGNLGTASRHKEIWAQAQIWAYDGNLGAGSRIGNLGARKK